MPSETSAHRLHAADGRKPHVVIVDGDPANATVTSLLVEQFGCTAIAVPSGEAALALLRSNREIVDLALIDLAIRDMDGIVAALLMREMKDRHDMPIIPLASQYDDLSASRSRAARFSSGLTKPYSPRQLFIVMNAALRHRDGAPSTLRSMQLSGPQSAKGRVELGAK